MVSIDGYEDVPVNDQAALEKAVSSQPVSVAICASEAMQFYSSGVIVGEGSCTGLNHGVLAAGYGKVRLPSFSSGLCDWSTCSCLPGPLLGLCATDGICRG